jgi:hypothetical protein
VISNIQLTLNAAGGNLGADMIYGAQTARRSPPPGNTAAAAKTTSSTQVGFLVGAKGTATDAEIAAAKTIEQVIVRFELARPGAVIVPNTTQ